ncbi:unnamed protein product [Lymnaea stagnalis]|uniref:Lengsin n=1 Tax=Lymnaea stagnalis TaxID=6523 RepID=A0AAV2IFI5_LYMST
MGSSHLDQLDQFDVVQLSLCGLSGAVRHLTLSAKKVKDVLGNSGSFRFGNIRSSSNFLIYDASSTAGSAEVDLSTLKPMPWLSNDGLRVGGAMCQLVLPVNHAEITLSPRAAAVKQVQRLKQEFGLSVQSAFEAEFMIFEKDEVTPFNNVFIEPYARTDNMSGREHALLGTCQLLEEAGLPLESFMTEFAAAQFELTFRPEEGVASADSIMVMKDGVKTNLGKNGMVATYMACPLAEGHANGFHFNHSLLTSDRKNAFLNADDPVLLSDTARHWIAGLVSHAPALTALLCPTINCYRRLADVLCPKSATWGVEDRSVFLRVKTEKRNVYMENRLPSSASNPYLVVAATLAAGMDGLAKKLNCPLQGDKAAPPIPRTPEGSMAALEQDDILRKAIGAELVDSFMSISRQGLAAISDGSDQLEYQRNVYFHAL